MQLNYPILYKGKNFEDGYKGCRILVLGHQAPATEGEEDSFINNRIEFLKKYKNNNIEIVKKDIIEEGYKTWKKEEKYRTSTWQKFLNIIYYPNKPAFDSIDTKDFLHKIAFANYLTKPCFNKSRIGSDAIEFYTNDLEAFKCYINEAFVDNNKPNIIIVWGSYTYPHIRSLSYIGDDTYCTLTNDNNVIINIIKITHPMIANQKETHIAIENFLNTILTNQK